MKLRFIAEVDVKPARALSIGARLHERVAGDDEPAALMYGASLSGEAVALGRHQAARSALDREAVERRTLDVVRRATGGPAVMARTGIVYAALALRHASVLMDCPRDRVLNRNVRGFLAGLGILGARAQYFGREHLAIDKRPAALVAWTRRDGAVLLEAFFAVDNPYALSGNLSGYPISDEHTAQTKEPITLVEALGKAPQVDEIVRALAEGHRDAFDGDVEVERASLSDKDRADVEHRAPTLAVGFDEPSGLVWSSPHAIPIGFVVAGIALEEDGTIGDVLVAGDFYDDEESAAHLSSLMIGKVPNEALFTASVAATWDGAARCIEGIKEMEPIVAALVEAHANAVR